MSGNTYHESVAESIFKRMRESKAILLSPSAHEDLLQIAYDAHGSDIKLAHSLNVHARKALMDAMKHQNFIYINEFSIIIRNICPSKPI